jgi:hypothetical protein
LKKERHMQGYTQQFNKNLPVVMTAPVSAATSPDEWKQHVDQDLYGFGKWAKRSAPVVYKMGGKHKIPAAAGAYVAGAGLQTWARLEAEKRAYEANGEQAPQGAAHVAKTFVKQLSPLN